MACHLLGAKLLSEPVQKMRVKMSLPTVGHFVPASMSSDTASDQ